MIDEEQLKEDFEAAWTQYWYKDKSVIDRLRDDINHEKEICLKFFLSMRKLF